ncbi:NAD(P)H-dependent FMN reductase [Terracoccus luteus]|uniref:NAD(P)H-dependent FMN reductase n=2 Tax=Terracoccus luteus TaxID=53356 RepID=A0A495Y3Q3_9MICO|nr:NAD(P)H-dependent FMN reductase [Terracoccus luteus]
MLGVRYQDETTESIPMSAPLLQVIVGSTRPGRVGIHVAEWFATAARQDGRFDVEVLDLAEIALPMFDEPNHPSMHQYTQPHTEAWSARVARGDAVVFVMPEYNWGVNPALKNAVDYLNEEWAYKPMATVSYGGVSAGLRAATALKTNVLPLRMIPIADAISIPFVAQFVTDGTFVPNDVLRDSVAPLLGELLKLTQATALLRGPASEPVPDEG